MVRNSNDVEGQGKVAGTPGAGVGLFSLWEGG